MKGPLGILFFLIFRDAAIRNNYICINPYHYGYETPAAQNSSTEHSCLKNARIQATGSTLKTICKICRRVLTEDDMTEGFFKYQKPAIPERSKIINYFIVLTYILHLPQSFVQNILSSTCYHNVKIFVLF